jgi:hypothetical protein
MRGEGGGGDDDDDEWGDAWQRHLQRNRSVLVDLFQGQSMSEVTCQSCKNNSRTFDPFMLLSVPLPKHSEKQISVYLIRKMPHLPRHPTTAYAESDSSAFLLPCDDEAGRLVPLYANSARKLKVLDLIVIVMNRLLLQRERGAG